MKKKRMMGPKQLGSNSLVVNIINKAPGLVSNQELKNVISALQQQLDQQFAPAWGSSAKLKIAPKADGKTPTLFILASSSQMHIGSGTLGFHDTNVGDHPVGFAFVKDTANAGFHWSSTVSHEMMEMISDPYANGWANARFQGQLAYFAYEACDPVQNDVYMLNGVQVSNFILPSWFISRGKATQWDFLGNLTGPLQVDTGGDAILFFEVGKILSLQTQVASSESSTPSAQPTHPDTTVTPIHFNEKSHILGSRWWQRWLQVKT